MVSAIEWGIIKSTYNYRCILCKDTEENVGRLVKAHLQAYSKGGGAVVPMCPNCHVKFDTGQLTDSQLDELSITRQEYEELLPVGAPRYASAPKTVGDDIVTEKEMGIYMDSW